MKIISMSLGFRGWWEDFIPIMQIIRSNGILPVIAVGNEGPGTSRSPGNYPTVLSVGAEDDRSAESVFRAQPVKLLSRILDGSGPAVTNFEVLKEPRRSRP